MIRYSYQEFTPAACKKQVFFAATEPCRMRLMKALKNERLLNKSVCQESSQVRSIPALTTTADSVTGMI
jgi:hypothetical protein